VIAEVQRAIDGALAARARMRERPIREIASALAAAAARWRADGALARALPEVARLTAPMVAAVLPLVAEQLDADTLVELHAREGRGDGPALVAHVLASNVPALAIPAIALALLARAAVVVKSGRADPHSASAFQRALVDVDPELGAMVVPTYWRGGARDVEDAVLARADRIVATGAEASLAALARFGQRVLAHGNRASVVVAAPDVDDAMLEALAWDVARYEQRGCLSPHLLLVVGGDARAIGERLFACLAVPGSRLPPMPRTEEERLVRSTELANASFAGGTVLDSQHGAVVVGGPRRPEGIGFRTVFVDTISTPSDLPDAFAPGTIECVGRAGDVALDVEALRARGVARLCRVGRMQRPRIDWPRGQRPALGSLFRGSDQARIQVEP
jgi:acyl-CoA reductase-like NAD-dependent aldehyde dehydrogenase